MKAIRLTVNGDIVTASVEPRMSLADFLRETLDLTGTHLGCEHGVCGACTLMIDGVPARSCITLAIACEGASIATIEGQDDDEIMQALRDAFSREHALQCGFCTPGMLASARDIVLRMPDATMQDIRVAMSGNLCRCTGYGGIVHAVHAVLLDRKARKVPSSPKQSIQIGPAGSGHAAATRAGGAAIDQPLPQATIPAEVNRPAVQAPLSSVTESRKPLSILQQFFTIDHPRDEVWDFFSNLGEVTSCLPGTTLLQPPRDDQVQARIRVKVGPIIAEFEGVAQVTRDAANFTGTIHGSAHDTRSRSATLGEIRYTLLEEKGGSATKVALTVGFTLTGSLAQFGRSGIVRDVVTRMTDVFAQNLKGRLNHEKGAANSCDNDARKDDELNVGSLMVSILINRIKDFFRKLF